MPRVVVRFDARSIVVTAGVLLGIAAAVKFVLLAQAGLTLIAIALFTAVALNPAAEFFARRGLARLWSVAAVYSMALALSVCLGLLFVPPLVEQVTRLVDALPGMVADLTRGHGLWASWKRGTTSSSRCAPPPPTREPAACSERHRRH